MVDPKATFLVDVSLYRITSEQRISNRILENESGLMAVIGLFISLF